MNYNAKINMPTTFLSIGHFCYDVSPNGYILGGSASYSTLTARNLGHHARAVTAVGENFDRQNPLLEGIKTVYHESAETTIFDNQYDAKGHRQQFILGAALQLKGSHVPAEWRTSDIAYLCPIANEVSAEIVHCFSDKTLIGATPQGWLRQWDTSGKVEAKRWETAKDILPHIDVLILSDEDLRTFPDELEKYIGLAPIVVLTQGGARCHAFPKWYGAWLHRIHCYGSRSNGGWRCFCNRLFNQLPPKPIGRGGIELRALCGILRCGRGRHLLYPKTRTSYVKIKDIKWLSVISCQVSVKTSLVKPKSLSLKTEDRRLKTITKEKTMAITYDFIVYSSKTSANELDPWNEGYSGRSSIGYRHT